MKVQTKLRIGSAAIALAVCVFIVVVLFFLRGIQNAYMQQQIAERIAEHFFQSAALRDEYVRFPGERPKTQWIYVHTSQQSLLNEAILLFDREPEKTIFDHLRKDIASRHILFGELVRSVESGRSPTVVQELNNQLSITSQARISDALRLAELSRQRAGHAMRMFAAAVLLLGIVIMSIVIAGYYDNMKIARSLLLLHRGTQIISGGYLAHRIPVSSNDEVGDVSSSFNVMAERLESAREDLESQIAKKTAALRETNAFLDSIIENIPNMIFLKDAKELRFVRFNKAGENLLGYDRADLIGKNDYDFFPREQADAFTAKDRDVLLGGVIVNIPAEPVDTRLQGRRILHTKKIPILGTDGVPRYLLGISEDITEVHREQAKLAAMLEALDRVALVSMTDRKGNITYVNTRFQEVSKYTREELLGQNHRILKSGRQPDALFDGLWRTISSGKVWRGEIQNKAKDGTFYWVDTSIAPLLTADGVPEHYISIRFLITQQKLLEEARTNFITMSSHQLRTPLTTIRWALSRARLAPELAPETRMLTEKAYSSSRQMTESINAMLQLTQITEESLQPQCTTVNLRELLSECISMQERIAKHRNIHIELRCPGALTITTDGSLLREAVANILSNACKYSPLGGVVTVNAEGHVGGATIVIRDHGCGIPADEQKKIGTMFFRARNVLDSEERGAGIGLHLVYALLRLLNGTMTVTSSEQTGTTVTLSLASFAPSASHP